MFYLLYVNCFVTYELPFRQENQVKSVEHNIPFIKGPFVLFIKVLKYIIQPELKPHMLTIIPLRVVTYTLKTNAA